MWWRVAVVVGIEEVVGVVPGFASGYVLGLVDVECVVISAGRVRVVYVEVKQWHR